MGNSHAIQNVPENIKGSQIRYIVKKANTLSDAELQSCSDLFSNHYGFWAVDADNGKAGQMIKMSVRYYKQNLCPGEDHYIVMAFYESQLVGHAFYIRKLILDKGYITWILQLVTHSEYRNNGIGRKLMQSIWSFSSDLAWGLATANPLTIRALEEATMREVTPSVIKDNLYLIEQIKKEVSFAGNLLVDDTKSFIDTGFYIDHSGVDVKIKKYGYDWKLGNELPSGMEWLAFTFSNQKIILNNSNILNNLVEFSEEQLKEAYGRMRFVEQKWAKSTTHEVDEIINTLNISSGQTIADFGCGQGRHSLEIAKRGYTVYGIDFVKSNIIEARNTKRSLKLKNVKFINGDCRNIKLTNEVDVAICLYDVVGSFPNEEDNIAIIENMYRNLKLGGYLVLSVMNMEYTKNIAKNICNDVYATPEVLLNLKPNNIMQSSGNVFNSNHLLIDNKTGTIFRKEQFENDGKLPIECIIRDRRYTCNGICRILRRVGFKILEAKCVELGKWDEKDSSERKAKEILIYAEKNKPFMKKTLSKLLPFPKGWL